MQPAALCQGRADVQVTNTGESSQLRTVSGDVLGNAAMRRHPFHKGIPQRTDMQSGLKTRRVEAGAVNSFSGVRGGRGDSAPPQLGQRRPRTRSAQSVHQVHSKEQIHASSAEGDRSRSQHSQLGRISSTLDHSTAGREAASPLGSCRTLCLTGQGLNHAATAEDLGNRSDPVADP